MSGVKITADKLNDAMFEILEDYGDIVYQSTKESLDAVANVLADALKKGSPKGKTGKYAKSWKVKEGKSSLYRYVYNSKTVDGKTKGGKDKKIALSDILEYSTKRGHPHIKRIYEESIPDMVNAAIKELKKEIK